MVCCYFPWHILASTCQLAVCSVLPPWLLLLLVVRWLMCMIYCGGRGRFHNEKLLVFLSPLLFLFFYIMGPFFKTEEDKCWLLISSQLSLSPAEMTPVRYDQPRWLIKMIWTQRVGWKHCHWLFNVYPWFDLKQEPCKKVFKMHYIVEKNDVLRGWDSSHMSHVSSQSDEKWWQIVFVVSLLWMSFKCLQMMHNAKPPTL